MPVNIMVGVLSLIVTLTLYTIAVWGAVRAKTVKRKHVVMLWIGFVFDVIATSMMAVQVGGIQSDLHSLVAFAGMFAMLGIAIAATIARRNGNEALLSALPMYAIPAWALWAGVFVWGMVSRGAERLG